MAHDWGSSTPLLHRNCVSTYTSKTHIKRFLSRQHRTSDEPVVKRTCRSDICPFNFKQHCLICRESVALSQIQNIKTAGDVLFNVEQLIDCPINAHLQMSSSMHVIYVMMIGGSKFACKLELQSVTYMLLIPSTTKTACRHLEDEMPQDETFMCVVGDLREDLSRIWNSIEVHHLYNFYK